MALVTQGVATLYRTDCLFSGAAASDWMAGYLICRKKNPKWDVTQGCHNSFNSLVNIETTQAHIRMLKDTHMWILNEAVYVIKMLFHIIERSLRSCIKLWTTHTCTVIKDSICLWLAVVIFSSLTFELGTHINTRAAVVWELMIDSTHIDHMAMMMPDFSEKKPKSQRMMYDVMVDSCTNNYFTKKLLPTVAAVS